METMTTLDARSRLNDGLNAIRIMSSGDEELMLSLSGSALVSWASGSLQVLKRVTQELIDRKNKANLLPLVKVQFLYTGRDGSETLIHGRVKKINQKTIAVTEELPIPGRQWKTHASALTVVDEWEREKAPSSDLTVEESGEMKADSPSTPCCESAW